MKLVSGRIDRALDPFDLPVHDPQDHFARLESFAVERALGRGEIGAQIEQVVLHPAKIRNSIMPGVQHADREAERAVRLVDRADRLDPGGMFGAARAIDEARRAVVAGAGVDLVELDHGGAVARLLRDCKQDGDHQNRQTLILDPVEHGLVLH